MTSTLLILVGCLIYLGIIHEQFLLSWLGLSFYITGLGHLGLGPQIYGKNKVGKISFWAKVLHLPVLLYTIGVWYLIKKISQEPPFNLITNEIVIGRRLLPKEVPPDMTTYIDLTAEFEEPQEIVQKENYLCFPILDGGVPSLQAFKQILAKISSGNTYIHCAQGHGRSGLFALGLLSKRGHIQTYEQGLKLLKTSRPALQFNKKQEIFIRDFLQHVNNF